MKIVRITIGECKQVPGVVEVNNVKDAEKVVEAHGKNIKTFIPPRVAAYTDNVCAFMLALKINEANVIYCSEEECEAAFDMFNN